MKKFRVHYILPGGIGMERYSGQIDVSGIDEDEAIQNAKMKIRRIYGNRTIKIEKVERLYD